MDRMKKGVRMIADKRANGTIWGYGIIHNHFD